MRSLSLFTAAWLILGSAVSLFAQGVQTGTIRGLVNDQQDLAVPGVSVTATSPALQGPRSTTTDAQGLYVLRALPPGEYQVRFELSGFGTMARTSQVPLGLVVVQDVSLRPAGVAETVQVTGELPATIATPVVGANYQQREIEALATPRTIQGIAQLSPALNESTPSLSQLIINGSFAFDNVFMINGVDVNDNISAQPQNLFIEDAIEETQVLTSGISAEYGRFTGGVINAITKSGGNAFSGSGRINFLNPAWTTETPFEECVDKSIVTCSAPAPHKDLLSRAYEGTFGGPIVRDRLWFFVSGRYQSLNTSFTLPVTSVSLVSNDNNKRGEIKVTGTVRQNHTIQGAYLNDPRKRTNNSGIQSRVIDPRAEPDRENPNWYSYGNYRGVLKSNLLAEAQYSERRFEFKGDGGTSKDIHDSPFIGTGAATFYNAPFFDATDPEQRNNRQLTGNITNYWSGAGRHETKVGYEYFRSQRTGGGSQSSTDYVFAVDFLTDAVTGPVRDSAGRLIPVFVPGESQVWYFPAVRGTAINIHNNSAFAQDHWTINDRWSADLGARFEYVKAISTGGIVSINSGRIVPRLAAAWDVSGTGDRIVHFTYGQYSGRYVESQIGANSPVGNPPEIDYSYTGPAGQGNNFEPGFAVSNYTVPTYVSDPLQNVSIEDGMKSPLLHEFSTSYGANLFDGRGHAEVSYIFRKTTNLIDEFQDRTTGTTNVIVRGAEAGEFTNIRYKNASSDVAHRRYQALVLQSRYRVTSNLTVHGHYTVQLENNGNYEGEASQTSGLVSPIGNFPEILVEARYYPEGKLQSFQRNRARIWGIYNFGMGPAGDLSFSGLWRLEGSRAYSLVARSQLPNAAQVAILAAAGYTDQPGVQHVFFGGERGTERFPGYGLLDINVSYNVPVFRTLRPWLKFDIYNVLDNQKLIAWDTTLRQDPASPTDSVGLRTGFTKGPNFGKATGNTATNFNYIGSIDTFPVPFNQGEPGAVRGGRTFRVALGFRF